MRDLNEYTVGSYMTLAMIAIYSPLVWIIDNGMEIIYIFDISDWILIVLLGVTGYYFNVLRFKAL